MRAVLPLALGSALLLASCTTTPAPDSSTLDFAAGTYTIQGTATPGTALLLRLMPGGTRPTEDVQVTVTGPAGWNEGAPLTLTYRANEPVFWSLRTIAAVSGTYTATAQVGGKTYTASTSVDATSRLDVPGNVMVAESANQSFTVSWQGVNGASAYLERVIRVVEDGPDELVTGTSVFTTGTSVTLPESVLALNTAYTTTVTAFNAPVNPNGLGNLVFTKQFNASVGVLPAVFFRTP